MTVKHETKKGLVASTFAVFSLPPDFSRVSSLGSCSKWNGCLLRNRITRRRKGSRGDCLPLFLNLFVMRQRGAAAAESPRKALSTASIHPKRKIRSNCCTVKLLLCHTPAGRPNTDRQDIFSFGLHADKLSLSKHFLPCCCCCLPLLLSTPSERPLKCSFQRAYLLKWHFGCQFEVIHSFTVFVAATILRHTRLCTFV